MESKLIAFVGGGNMATSLIGGLLADGYSPGRIRVAEPDASKRQTLASRFSVSVYESNAEATDGTDVVILSVKPQVLREVAHDLGNTLKARPLLISIAAGVRTDSLLRWLGDAHWPLVRAMPNTPALIKCGMTGLYATRAASDGDHATAQAILNAVGATQWVEDEALMDAVTAVSGSGPAYFFLFMESMQSAAEQLGLKSEIARTLVLQTALGAARMAIESGEAPTRLRRRVTSPGGTTERALDLFQQGGLDELMFKALEGAMSRSKALAQELD